MNWINNRHGYGWLSLAMHWLMLLLLLIAAAALHHHYFLHDNTMRLMMPRR